MRSWLRLWPLALAAVLAAVAAWVQLRPKDQPPLPAAAPLAWLPTATDHLVWVTPARLSVPPGSPAQPLFARALERVAKEAGVDVVRDVDEALWAQDVGAARGRFQWARMRPALERSGFGFEQFHGRELAHRAASECLALDGPVAVFGALEAVRAALLRRDRGEGATPDHPLARAVAASGLSPGALAAVRPDEKTRFGRDLREQLSLGTAVLSLNGRGDAWWGELVLWPRVPSELPRTEEAVRKVHRDLLDEVRRSPHPLPWLKAAVESARIALGDGTVRVEARVPGDAAALPEAVLDFDDTPPPEPPEPPPADAPPPPPSRAPLRLLEPAPGSRQPAGAEVPHRWSEVPGADRYLVDFAAPSPDGRCSFDTAREVRGAEASYRHDDAQPLLVVRVRAVDAQGRVLSLGGGWYGVGAAPPQAFQLQRCLDAVPGPR